MSLRKSSNGLSNLVSDVLYGRANNSSPSPSLVSAMTRPKSPNEITDEKIKNGKIEESEEYCKIKTDYLTQLKDSTKKLLCIIDELQSKTHSSRPIPVAVASIQNTASVLPPSQCPSKIRDLIDSKALKELEEHAKKMDGIYLENVDDDCSIYKRLVRKCVCLNRKEYNDFMIHFNEGTKFVTTNLGEIIKNVRILKKFLYMGNDYTKNALRFLNEILAARLLNKLVLVEEGRRYLNFNFKVTNDIKKILKRKNTDLNGDILDLLNSTMNILSPSLAPLINATYYCKADEGITNKILNSLLHFRLSMTLEETKNNLDLLNKLSETNHGRQELQILLETLFRVFRYILIKYDNSEMNVLMTNTLINLISKPKNEANNITPKTFMICHVATEPIPVKNEILQMPSYKNLKRDIKSRLYYLKPTVNKN